jgi:7,8-dihydropterin-6-yl-methyl-4-(beta-D-ribofuranosyl)aminobenzene 5'-phosphate synthase
MDAVRSLKVTTIADNLVQFAGLHGQWGLSFLLELEDARGDRRKVILDTGNDREPLLHNVKRLRVDLGDVDCLVISHGHQDHTAANVDVVEAAGGVRVYAHPDTFRRRIRVRRDGTRRVHGVPEGQGIAEIEAAGGEVVLSRGPVEVVPGLRTTGEVPRVSGFETIMQLREGEGVRIVVDGEEVDDLILDDQALWADVRGAGPFVLLGCAHAGPINTLTHVRRLGGFDGVYGVVGGTHLVGRDEAYVRRTMDEVRRFSPRLLSPCHCTGFRATARFAGEFPESFALNFCGRVIEAGREPEPRLV